jgi:hypothetical protein
VSLYTLCPNHKRESFSISKLNLHKHVHSTKSNLFSFLFTGSLSFLFFSVFVYLSQNIENINSRHKTKAAKEQLSHTCFHIFFFPVCHPASKETAPLPFLAWNCYNRLVGLCILSAATASLGAKKSKIHYTAKYTAIIHRALFIP